MNKKFNDCYERNSIRLIDYLVKSQSKSLNEEILTANDDI